MARAAGSSLGLGRDIGDSVTHGLDVADLFVGNIDTELVLESHDQLDDVQTVGTEVFRERSGLDDLFLLHAQLFDGYLLNSIENVLRHISRKIPPISFWRCARQEVPNLPIRQ